MIVAECLVNTYRSDRRLSAESAQLHTGTTPTLAVAVKLAVRTTRETRPTPRDASIPAAEREHDTAPSRPAPRNELDPTLACRLSTAIATMQVSRHDLAET
jgi:hypothetical protein